MLNDNEAGMELMRQLHGWLHIIVGNHDTITRRALYETMYNVTTIENSAYLKYDGYNFYLSHYPTICSNFDYEKPLHKRLINLCGHSHTTDRFSNWDNGVIYHCELDAHNNRPALIDDIISELEDKINDR